jgi:hypothetical protein
MVGPEVRVGFSMLLTLATAMGLSSGCGGTPPPEPSPITVPPTTAPPPPPKPRPLPPIVVEITPAETGVEKPSLVDVARAERERRKKSARPVAVINNKNLKDFAKDGELTYVEEEPPTAAADPESKVATAEGAVPVEEGRDSIAPPTEDPEAQERFWRSRFLELRLEWQRTVEDLEDFESQAAALRRRFYAEDDPFVRDGQIKPEWDLVLERQAKAREALRRYPRDLDRLYDQARNAEVEWNWTQEGIEIQPLPLPDEGTKDENSASGLPAHEIQEPTIIDEEVNP